MNHQHPFYYILESTYLFLFGVAWWLKILLILIAAATAAIYHLMRIRKVSNERGDLERQLLEKNELLLYAAKNEQKANDKLIKVEQSRGLLMSKLNHEIRTPMNGILGMASLMNDTGLNSEQREYNNTIISSGQSLLKVINEIMMDDILEYAKVESGKELEAKEIDLANCIEEVLDMFAVKAAHSGIELLYNIEENVPLQIVGDVKRIRQVLMNLVENAIKFTSKGEIYIGVKLLECRGDNRIKLEFEVRDTGRGIAADKKGLVLEKISLENTSGINTDTGLGLVICNRLVSLMGGAISLESKENEGTVIRFTIFSKPGMKTVRTHTMIADLENKKVLIVDDNSLAADLLKRRLESLKMVISTATSGKEALDILTQVSFDLVITDLQMPEMNGIELSKSIKEKYGALPLMLLNTVTDEQYKRCPDTFGAVVNKPVKVNALLDAVLSQLRNPEKGAVKKQKGGFKLSAEFSKQYPLKILLAEDNLVNQNWTTKILTKLGYQTDVVNNGKEVLEVVSAKQYDLILMDVQMPEMDGLEATRMIRLCLEAQPVVIAMTANVMQGDRQECMQSGMDDYISKPVELNDLVAMLEKWGLLVKEKKQLSSAGKS